MINVNTDALMSTYVSKGACARQAKVTTVLNKDIIDNVAQDVRTETFVGESLAIQEAILNSKNPLVRGFLNKELEDLLYSTIKDSTASLLSSKIRSGSPCLLSEL